MEKLKFIQEKSYRCFQLPNGKLVDVYSCNYDAKVDLEEETFCSCCEKEYSNIELPTFNELVDKGIVKEVSCIERSYDVYPEDFDLSEQDYLDIIKEFEKNGFNVTLEALKHNYRAWFFDAKSGYRDEENGYHLFSPCGCNPLSFRATTLHKQCEDWQTTYIY